VPTLTIDALGGVDNVALDLTLAALKSRRVCFSVYETHLSAIQANTQTSAWFSCPHENERGPRNLGTPPSTRPETFAPKRGGKALRAPYTGVTLSFPADLALAFLDPRSADVETGPSTKISRPLESKGCAPPRRSQLRVPPV
jgi:hypothetical protein